MENNSLYFTKDSSFVKIKLKDHNFKPNQNIILQNVKSTIYRSKGGIELTDRSFYIKIYHNNHNANNNHNLQIKISGVEGLDNKYFLGNIPISSINTTHKVYYSTDDYNVQNNNFYFIKQDIKTNINDDTLYDNNSNVTIEFLDLFGIPLNNLNANYPLNTNQLFGYHKIEEIINKDFYNKIKKFKSIKTGNGGGNSMFVSLIRKEIPGFPNPSDYEISLNTDFISISRIIFLNFQSNFKFKSIEKNKNDKLYWEILNNSEIIYNISLETGNYDIEQLVKSIKNKINTVKYITQEEDYNQNNDNNNTIINNNQYFDSEITIDESSNLFEIYIYKVIHIQNCIFKLNLDTIDDKNIRIRINHPNHGLVENDTIFISGAISTESIPASILNNKFQIEKIIDNLSYQIKLPIFNDDFLNSKVTGGGKEIKIKIPTTFRLFFNKKDTFEMKLDSLV